MIFGKEVSEKKMLSGYRKAAPHHILKYKKRNGIWTGFPKTITWQHAYLSRADFESVSLVRNEINWIALGGYFREPLAAARWVNDHLEHNLVMHDYNLRMKRGKFPKFPCLLVGPPNPCPEELVVLDGNHRIVAALMGNVDATQLPILVGTSPKIDKWAFYRDGKKIRHTLNSVGWQ